MDRICINFSRCEDIYNSTRDVLMLANDLYFGLQKVAGELGALSDGDVIRNLHLEMHVELRRFEQILDRLSTLTAAMTKAIAMFDEAEHEITESIGALSLAPLPDNRAVLSSQIGGCIVGEPRFQTAYYLEWLSKAARDYYAADLRCGK